VRIENRMRKRVFKGGCPHRLLRNELKIENVLIDLI